MKYAGGRAPRQAASEELRQELTERVMAVIGLLFAHRRRVYCAEPIHRDVSISQLHILMTLQQGGPTMVSDVAAQLHVSTPSASSILDRMEEHGLVERARDEVDRRVVHVAISDRGRVVVDELTGIKRASLQSLLAVMSTEEVVDVLRGAEVLQRGLSRLQDNTVEQTSPTPA